MGMLNLLDPETLAQIPVVYIPGINTPLPGNKATA